VTQKNINQITRLKQQRAELEEELQAQVKAYRETRRIIRLIDMQLLAQGAGALRGIGAPKEKSKVAFAATLNKVLEEDRRQRNVTQLVREIIQEVGFAHFDVRSLIEEIRSRGRNDLTERDVAQPLIRLRKQGLIKVWKKGSGRRPAMYLIIPPRLCGRKTIVNSHIQKSNQSFPALRSHQPPKPK
jgi:hypothetical protein